MERKIALVTGANRGIGLEIVRQLSEIGISVILGSRDFAKGETAATKLNDEGMNVPPVQLDVTNDESIERIVKEVEREFERLDVLINNAGILYDTWQKPSNADFKIVREAFETNTLGAWRMCKAFAPLLKKSAAGRIVNVSSEAGSLAVMGAGTPAYSVSKAALNAVTKLFAAELKSDRILVNSVCPGWVATEMGGSGGRPVAEGAASVVWAATLPHDGATGGFFRDGKPLDW